MGIPSTVIPKSGIKDCRFSSATFDFFFFNLFVYFNTKQLMTSLYFAISHWLWKTEGFKVALSCEEGSDSLMI